MTVDDALRRLQQLLPLAERQRDLDPEFRVAHRAILRFFVEHGRSPESSEISRMAAGREVMEALRALALQDLIVYDAKSERTIGAYPFTSEETPHRLTFGRHSTHAMCAVDALAVSPMFGVEVVIESSCHVTSAPISVRQLGSEILETQPSRDVRVGVLWQSTKGCAAHNLCTEMIFLRGPETASDWQQDDEENKSLFTLPEAIELGARFFVPLVEEPAGAASG